MFVLFKGEVAGKDTEWYQGEENQLLRPRRYPMPVTIICLDNHLRYFAQRFHHRLSKPNTSTS